MLPYLFTNTKSANRNKRRLVSQVRLNRAVSLLTRTNVSRCKKFGKVIHYWQSSTCTSYSRSEGEMHRHSNDFTNGKYWVPSIETHKEEY
mmetsp:Transcript_27617/g.31059  ORF Transcript_27617/g.31059 Transcript_27617/m.31059 type:complete len:90 (+) Transcript_27617:131-400(+)